MTYPTARGSGLIRSRAGFTLIEIVMVMALVAVLALSIAALLWGAIEVERADAAVFRRVKAQGQLADRFRGDVARAVDCPDSFEQFTAGPECLILRDSENRVVVYRWSDERLTRRDPARDGATAEQIAVGGEFVSVRFDRGDVAGGLVSLWLVESRGAGGSRRDWPVEITAAMGAELK